MNIREVLYRLLEHIVSILHIKVINKDSIKLIETCIRLRFDLLYLNNNITKGQLDKMRKLDLEHKFGAYCFNIDTTVLDDKVNINEHELDELIKYEE